MPDPARTLIRHHAKDLVTGDVIPAGGLPPGVVKPTGLTVHTRRTRPLDQDSLPAAAIYSGEESIARTSHAPDVMRDYRLIVEWRVTGSGPEDIEDELDLLLTYGTQVLLADPTFGGLTVDVEETQIEWAAEELDKVYGAAAQVFTAKYATALANPEELS